VRQRRPEQPPRAGQVDVDREVPGVVVERLQRHPAGDAGVGDGDVDAAELRGGARDQRVDARRIAHVDLGHDGARGDRRADGLDVVRVAGEPPQRDVRARLGEHPRGGGADPRCRAGDDGHPAGQLEHQSITSPPFGHSVCPT
jgi:hypothetical protein